MVGPANDTKLSAFRNMCFSKPPHFGNRGAASALGSGYGLWMLYTTYKALLLKLDIDGDRHIVPSIVST